MRKFKVIVLRSQYQNVIVDAEDHEHAKTLAVEMFDPDQLLDQETTELQELYNNIKETE
jgi:hypothetical protein